MKILPRIAKRPDLVSTNTASIALTARHDGARGERVKQHVHVGFGQQLVGRDLERRDVVRLGKNLVLNRQVRLVEAVHSLEAREDVVRDTVHDLLVLPVHDGMQTAERAQALPQCPRRRKSHNARCRSSTARRGPLRSPPRYPPVRRRPLRLRSPRRWASAGLVRLRTTMAFEVSVSGLWAAVCRGIRRESRRRGFL